MMRALWTAATGMIGQQQNVDTITNNLANVNTTGYKRERMEFKSLLYDTMKKASLDEANQTGRPVNLQIGYGVRPIATSRIYTQGNMQVTDNPEDFCIEGQGFFVVQRAEDNIAYTKDGSFKFMPVDEGLKLCTAEGYPILGVNDEPVVIPFEVNAKDVIVDDLGSMTYTNEDGETVDLGVQMKLVQFSNPQGLEAIGSNLLKQTSASGLPLAEANGEVNKRSNIVQGSLEMANVQIALEMVNLIVAQRAYELNSKAIQTSDDMLQNANNLKRG